MIAEHEAIGSAAVNSDGDDDLLDAYSLAVSTAAERLIRIKTNTQVRVAAGCRGGWLSGVMPGRS